LTINAQSKRIQQSKMRSSLSTTWLFLLAFVVLSCLPKSSAKNLRRQRQVLQVESTVNDALPRLQQGDLEDFAGRILTEMSMPQQRYLQEMSMPQ